MVLNEFGGANANLMFFFHLDVGDFFCSAMDIRNSDSWKSCVYFSRFISFLFYVLENLIDFFSIISIVHE